MRQRNETYPCHGCCAFLLGHQGCPNRKQKKKALAGSGETAKQKQDWKKMEGKWRDRFKFTRT